MFFRGIKINGCTAAPNAFTKEPNVFDEIVLHSYIEALPEGYTIARIDEPLYHWTRTEGWARDFCSQFAAYAESHRRKGLAAACAAKLILECLDRELYPSWDAANRESVALASKLGYHFDKAYVTYEVTGFRQESYTYLHTITLRASMSRSKSRAVFAGLAERFEVTRRTIGRDIDARKGIGMVSERYKLIETYGLHCYAETPEGLRLEMG